LKKNKEQDAYLMGMEHALDVVKRHGVAELETEVRYRHEKPLPLNVSPSELIAVARTQGVIKRELYTQAIALAWAVTKEMNLAPSQVTKLLAAYNGKVDELRFDDEKAKACAEELGKYSKLNKAAKDYLDFEKIKKGTEENE
jgi:EAL domain-containing protein (putative c-di-GMP-specific phosphodiesterase class I)